MDGRPKVRWHHAVAELTDFALVTWAADPERVAALLPAGFEPDIRDGAALVSLVAFRDRHFHFRLAPPVRFSAGQVNYRAYVRRGGERGVWFFGTSLSSRLVQVARTAWQMPWHHESVRVASRLGEAGLTQWRLRTVGGWGSAAVDLRGTGRALPTPAGFADQGEASRILLDPALGWYPRRDGTGIGRYSVWHQPLALRQAEVTGARSQALTALGLIAEDQPPCHAGLQHSVLFDVHTPPRRQLG
ncbi:DUF2071 domain-containing protein [Kitasatospora sp. GAS1066B]|uniref:DUF2071 domain-containing protein n=1 Tax=Kitasatospora sp. GAS1066B TaxID=3156271 RepID=UPI00351291F9